MSTNLFLVRPAVLKFEPAHDVRKEGSRGPIDWGWCRLGEFAQAVNALFPKHPRNAWDILWAYLNLSKDAMADVIAMLDSEGGFHNVSYWVKRDGACELSEFLERWEDWNEVFLPAGFVGAVLETIQDQGTFRTELVGYPGYDVRSDEDANDNPTADGRPEGTIDTHYQPDDARAVVGYKEDGSLCPTQPWWGWKKK